MIKIDRKSVNTEILLSPRARKAMADARKFFKLKLEERIQRSHLFDPEIYHHSEVRQALQTLFHGKCAYCETPLTGSSMGATDHFRPKAGALGLDGILAPDHYWWLAYRWENLYLSCEICNFNKGNKFPMVEGRAAVNTLPPRIYEAERPLLLDPCHDEPDGSLLFTDEGIVMGQDERGKTTIDILALNRDELVKERGQALRLLSAFLSTVESFTASQIDPQLFERFLSPEMPYLGATRQFLGRWLSRRQSILKSHGIRQQMETLNVSFETRPPASAVKAKAAVKKYLKEQHKRETGREEVTIGISNYIQRIEVSNFRVIKKLSLAFPEPRQDYIPSMVLLGENGVGKSSVLKAVALALMDERDHRRLKLDASKVIRYGSRSGFVRVFVSGYSRPFEVYFRRDDPRFHKKSPDSRVKDQGKPNKLQMWMFGYGGTRLLPLPGQSRPEHAGLARVDNLFNPFMPLEDARTWLLSLKGKDGNQIFGHSARAIKKLLLRREDDTLIRRRNQVLLNVPAFGTTIPLEELSDGYQATVALAADIMSVALTNWKAAEFAEGIVLVDEIDVHLHPSWKMEIIARLREVFPRMQFLITTHDPLCLLGTRPGEIQVLTRDPETKQIQPTQVDLPPGITPDQVLTGFWFGLPSTYDENTRQLLEEHRQLLRQGVREDDTRRLELEGELRKRLGTFADTSIDRMAQSVAAKMLTEEHRVLGPQERKELYDNLLARLRHQQGKQKR